MARAVDATLAEGHTADAIDARIVDRVLVGGALRAAVGRMEVERSILARAVGQVTVVVAAVALDHADILHLAVDLVGGGIDEEAIRALEATASSTLNVPSALISKSSRGSRDRSGDRDLRRQDATLRPVAVRQRAARSRRGRGYRRARNGLALAPQPIEIVLRATPRQIVENRNRPPCW